MSYREHLEAAERAKPGAGARYLIGPRLPEGTETLWAWFLDLSIGRSYSAGGTPLPLSNGEIWCWCQLHGIRLEPWQLRALRLLDVNQVSIMAKRQGLTEEDLSR